MYQPNTGYVNGIPQPMVDAYGRPLLSNMTYEQRIAYTQELTRQRNEYIEKRLKENHPTKFAIVYSIIMILISLAEIALHIVLITNNGAFYFVGHGIWGGVLCLVLPITALVLTKFRKYQYFTLSYIVHSLGIALVICSLVMIASISFIAYQETYSRLTKKTTSDANRSMIPVTAVMIALGAIAFILCIVYLIMLCRITYKKPQIVNYNNGAPLHLPNLSTNPNMNPTVNNFQSPYPPPYASNESIPIIPQPLKF